MSKPLVSIIIPVYNGEEFLTEALQSVLNQDYSPLELIVVDDGSTDESATVAMSFRDVKLLRKPHSGVAETLNLGIRHARGEFLAFLDADDRWLPGKLTRQAVVLEQQPLLDMVFGLVRQFWHATRGKEEPREMGTLQPGINKGSMLIRRTSFERVQEFVVDAETHDFVDWYARALDMGLRSFMLPYMVYERRIHGRNLGCTRTAEQRRGYLGALRKALLRRQSLATKNF